jgi:hypothetical protein
MFFVGTGDPMGDPYPHVYGYGYGVNPYPPVYMGDPIGLFFCRGYVYGVVIPDGYLLIAISNWDEALGETHTAVSSDFDNDTQTESNCSPELEPSQTSASNSGSFESRLGVRFRISKRARREDSRHIYIARV